MTSVVNRWRTKTITAEYMYLYTHEAICPRYLECLYMTWQTVESLITVKSILDP